MFQNPGFALGAPAIKNKIWFFTTAYPQFTNYDRTVKFLRDGSVASFQRNDRQDFTLTLLDFQPFEKLRGSFGYPHNPYRVRGLLPSQQGTDNPPNVNTLRGQGSRPPATSFNYQADWTASSKFLVRFYGGFQYSSYKGYGVPRVTYIAYAAQNLNLPNQTLPIPPPPPAPSPRQPVDRQGHRRAAQPQTHRQLPAQRQRPAQPPLRLLPSPDFSQITGQKPSSVA
jgi:hypothetical protein